MCGCDASGPLSTAFFASRPAASITLGFEVLVHEVIAAISTSPLPMSRIAAGASIGVGRLSTISTSRARPDVGCRDSRSASARDARSFGR